MKILAIGAHYDDVELNCAGTLFRAKDMGYEIYLVVCTNGDKGGSVRKRKQEQKEVSKIMGYKKVFELGFEDGMLDVRPKFIDKLSKIVYKVKPDFVITHTDDDFHQDHRAVSQAVRVVNRFSLFSTILFPSQDSKLPFLGNFYVDITDYFEKKIKLLKKFKTQNHRDWFKRDVLSSRNLGIGKALYSEKFTVRFLMI